MKKIFAITALLALSSQAFSLEIKDWFSDGQTLEILKTRNDGEIAISRYVISKSTNSDVKKFAQQNIDDHTLNNMKRSELVTPENKPETSWKIEVFKKEIAESQKKLLTLQGKELDVAYVNDRIKYHEGIIDGIKHNLFPITFEPSLKKHLESVLQKEQQHLNLAKALRQKL
ncbi:MAG: DUF4142 domain-containing protein [Bdellovibrionota bacterium]